MSELMEKARARRVAALKALRAPQTNIFTGLDDEDEAPAVRRRERPELVSAA
ncbi:hypothetical protein SAMN04490244_10575 [Tranquillimonas rosea]|uniref:Uncharacterized protein n=1 Tax=Tranquillimonas rosea TaxID=641238 RepID=A0A1H9U7R1_9RHOB|nr:hypothetical protein [Tranquillimonas rosea]SES05187.1 hypothetical protein SAMN04490244_10575 [Tranquillimonas rosea]